MLTHVAHRFVPADAPRKPLPRVAGEVAGMGLGLVRGGLADLGVKSDPLPAPHRDLTTDPAPRLAPRARMLDLVSGPKELPHANGASIQGAPLPHNHPPDPTAHPSHIAKRPPATPQAICL